MLYIFLKRFFFWPIENDLSIDNFARKVKIAYIWISSHPAKTEHKLRGIVVVVSSSVNFLRI